MLAEGFLSFPNADHQMGMLSLVPNVWTKYGWNPAEKWLQVLKDMVEEYTGDPYITFEQVLMP